MIGFVSSQGSAFYASEIVSGQSGAPLYLQLDWSLSTTPFWRGSWQGRACRSLYNGYLHG